MSVTPTRFGTPPDQPLPSEVSVRSETWLTRARTYPVFSRTWYRYRAWVFVSLLAAIDLLAISAAWVAGKGFEKFFVLAVPLSLGVACLYLLGPGLAVWIRQRGYPARKEAWLLAAVLFGGSMLSWASLEISKAGLKYLVFGDANVVMEFNGKFNGELKKLPVAGGNALPSLVTPIEKIRDSKNVEENPALKLLLEILNTAINGFLIIYLGGGIDLWLFFRQRKRLEQARRQRELQQAQAAQREAELRLSVLVAQVEPHFLFNTLAGVRSAIISEPQRATAIVDHLVDYLRATIPQMRDDGGSVQARLAQQLDAARAYLGLMQARIPRLSFSVEAEVADAALPPLMLISLVENAVKHGVEPKIGPAHISVSARRLQQDGHNLLELCVADNGVGFGGATSGSGIGLANIRARLEAMYGSVASLQLKARAEGGVAASIVLPLTV